MATTWIKPLHVNKGKSIAKTLELRTDYAENPDKTEGGELVVGYGCDPRSADEEFLLAKSEYTLNSGHDHAHHNVIAYHLRQSFKPGEITPQEALTVGHELALRFTKGNHAFIVAVHTDRKHIHCHIVFNSTTLDCMRKFKNFWGSSFAIRRLSDLICLEHGLSIVENPKPSRGSYADWLGDDRKPTYKEVLRQRIDEIAPQVSTFDAFLEAMKAAGFTASENRRYISFLAPGQKRPTRMKSLGEEYSEEAIRARLGMVRVISNSDSGVHTRVNLLIDIQQKIQDGKGAGYQQWAKIFNLKQSAKTLIFLKENGIDSYEDLKQKASNASGDFAVLTKRIREIEARQKDIAELQKQIGTYSKTREVYAKYKASGWSRAYYDAQSGDIILHRAAKKHFSELGVKKLPSISTLKREYGTLATERKTLYKDYHRLKDLSHELSTACANAEHILGIRQERQTRSHSQER